MNIYRWDEIKDRFQDNLIIGNGASIAIDPRFNYGDIFKFASEQDFLDEKCRRLFAQFNETHDFELILEKLLSAWTVNKVLGVDNSETIKTYNIIRDALINAICGFHPNWVDVQSKFPCMYRFLDGFKTVFCLNYDLLIYWSILAANDDNIRTHKFKDAFVKESLGFEKDFEFLRTSQAPGGRVTLIFYPHGALFIGKDQFGQECKIAREADSQDLLKKIREIKEDGYTIPLIVSEGSSSQKIETIYRSQYLRTIYEKGLSKIKGTLAIYGWAVNDNDKHIIESFRLNDINRIAISVFSEGENPKDVVCGYEKKLRPLFPSSTEIVCFDANSCWINAS